MFHKKGYTEALDANCCVYMSDTAIEPAVKANLQRGATRLEDAKEVWKDWHPGSDEKVLDLVHPSLFPLIYGRSRVLPRGVVPLYDCEVFSGLGETIPLPSDSQNTEPSDNLDKSSSEDESVPFAPGFQFTEKSDYSDKFQWLPADISYDGGKVKVRSYINLHPSGNEDLYSAVEHVIASAIPLWIETLVSTQFPGTHRIGNDFGDGWTKKPSDENPDEQDIQETEDENDNDDDDDEEDLGEPAIPHPKESKPRQKVRAEILAQDPNVDATDMEKEFHHIHGMLQQKGFQVIVKLANIHLTPKKSTYDGGSWHIEGKLNEHIVASALYYYDSENITDSYLAFREGVESEQVQDLGYPQERYQALTEIFGIQDHGRRHPSPGQDQHT
jgi:hypothetical protein